MRQKWGFRPGHFWPQGRHELFRREDVQAPSSEHQSRTNQGRIAQPCRRRQRPPWRSLSWQLFSFKRKIDVDEQETLSSDGCDDRFFYRSCCRPPATGVPCYVDLRQRPSTVSMNGGTEGIFPPFPYNTNWRCASAPWPGFSMILRCSACQIAARRARRLFLPANV